MHDTAEYITLTEAAKIAPGRPSTNCLWRWCRKGVLSRGGRRVHLKHVRIGGKLFTARKWVEAFGLELAAADTEYFDLDEEASVAPRPRQRTRSERQREAEIERAERELREAGV